jgi:hypothetical protein
MTKKAPKVTEDEFAALFGELHALTKAWEDRHGLDDYEAAGIFLQVGVLLAKQSETPLDKVLDHVRSVYATIEKQP